MTGNDGQNRCLAMGSNLTSIHSDNENDFIYRRINVDAWLGLYRIGSVSTSFAYYDETPFNYKNWHSGEPNNHGGNEGCAEAQMLYILLIFSIQSVFSACPPSYTFSSDFHKCYKVYEQPQTYFAAAHACTMDGTQLVSIHSNNENAYVNGLVPDQFGFNHWIGLTTLIGGFDWEWLDDTTVDYAEWRQPAQPSKCAILEYDTNRWLTQDCNMKLPYICNFKCSTNATAS